MKNKILTAVFGIAVFFFIITISIGLPIYLRFFYYLQIESLSLPQKTGLSIEEIRFAFDDVMNFLTLPNYPFGTGSLSYTPAGKAHFVDCKALFNLNLTVLIVSTTIIVTLLALSRFKIFSFCRPFGMSVTFISAISIFIVAFILIGIVAIDFENAFVVFHHLFFPGKDNWQFTDADQIIKILPQEFFMNCAILIGVGIVTISLGIIIFQLVKKRKTRKKRSENL
ncbi:MAG: TIGR01906 family membrane protein [Clostridia bacterium]|nr:TIGR01906 family membrane protein [Clostridia bacterium]